MSGLRWDRDAVSDYCGAITTGLPRGAGAPLVGVALKHLRKSPQQDHPEHCTQIGAFRWDRPGFLWSNVQDYARRCEDEDWAWAHRLGLVKASQHLVGHWMAALPMVRLVACAEAPVDQEGRPRGGRPRRGQPGDGARSRRGRVRTARGDDRPYAPTDDDACGMLADLGPTLLLGAGGGVPPLWLFDAPVPMGDRIDRLARDLRQHVKALCDEHGWAFDSPHPLTRWTPVPGTYDSLRQRLVTVLVEGERWTLNNLRALVPRYAHHEHTGYWPDMTTWNGVPIPGRYSRPRSGGPVPTTARPPPWPKEEKAWPLVAPHHGSALARSRTSPSHGSPSCASRGACARR